MDKWQTRRILILGTTYPSHSKKYVETVCTGGIFEDTFKMCRLYPIPQRYLEPEHRVHKFQFIEARITKDNADPRPESYKIDFNSIALQETIPASNADKRRHYLESSPHLCKSVEDLKERQQRDGTSLGIVIPETILDCYVEMKSKNERQEWEEKEKIRAAQERLFGTVKALDFPEANFCVKWQCADTRCQGHDMHLLQWGINELYRKYDDPEEAKAKVREAMQKQLDQWQRDVFLFLGNFRTVLYNFGLMDSYSAPVRQPEIGSLFR